jgi:hypothetical protein
MNRPTQRPNPVSALRSHSGLRKTPILRRFVLGLLLAGGTIAALIVVVTDDRLVRARAGVVAVVCILAAVIAWLAGVSRTLSDSGCDPQDFSGPPGAVL